MAEPLVARYGPEVPGRIADRLSRADPAFPSHAFLAQALDGYEALALMPRARHVARALGDHLPADYRRALDVVLRSLGPVAARTEGDGMAGFELLPFTYWIAERGLDDLEGSVRAMHAITQRFTFEFGIRAFLDHHPQAMLAVLGRWCDDPSPHVRRLVSEGTRPRLPWATRLRVFGRDPRTTIALLERLRDDPDETVRRSVANHLNDVGRADPALLVEVCTRWAEGAPPARLRLVRHALRSLVKGGDPRALTVLGYGARPRVALRAASLAPARPRIGGAVEIAFELSNEAPRGQRLLVDLRIAYARGPGAHAGAAPRVRTFKLATVALAPGEAVALRKRVALHQMTTRTHHPGTHAVEALVNGVAFPMGTFELRPAAG